MKRFSIPKMGIATKFTTLVAILVILVLTGFSYLAIVNEIQLAESLIEELRRSEKKVEKEFIKKATDLLEKKGKNGTELVTKVSKESLYNFSPDSLDEFFQAILEDPEIFAIYVQNIDKEPFSAGWKENGKIKVKAYGELPESLNLENVFHRTMKIIREGENVGEATLYITDIPMKEEVERKKEESERTIKRFQKITEESKNKAIKNLAILTIVSIIFIVVIIFVVLHFLVIRPINITKQMTQDIAEGEGDLTKRLAAKSGDEIGELCYWFDVFMNKLQDIIKDLGSDAQSVDTSSLQLSSLSEAMNRGTKDTDATVSSMVERTEKMSQMMSSVENIVSDASTNAGIIASSSEEMYATIEEISKNVSNALSITQKAVKEVEDTTKRVEELGKAAKEISNVTENISDISEQVNLLALNATIEAARAGEAGKGFAVVAQEIKELAKQTSEATLDINKKVDRIQSTTSGTIEGISTISGIVREINEIVETISAAIVEQSATTKEITKNITEMDSGIANIKKSTQETASISQELTDGTTDVTKSVTSIRENSNNVEDSAKKLVTLAGNLNKIVGSFKV